MQHDGYSPVIHTRCIDFDGNKKIEITDSLSRKSKAISTIILAEEITPKEDVGFINLCHGQSVIARLRFTSGTPNISEYNYSSRYGIKRKTYGIAISFEIKCVVEIIMM